jgi:hypothetical protein
MVSYNIGSGWNIGSGFTFTTSINVISAGLTIFLDASSTNLNGQVAATLIYNRVFDRRRSIPDIFILPE